MQSIYHLPYSINSHHVSFNKALFKLASAKSLMKQTREQAILLFSEIFNWDGGGLCRFL